MSPKAGSTDVSADSVHRSECAQVVPINRIQHSQAGTAFAFWVQPVVLAFASPLFEMPVVSQQQHPKSLDFDNQRRAYLLRKEGYSLTEVAEMVENLEGDPSTPDTVSRCVARFSVKKGLTPYAYKNCGRFAWKLTDEVEKWLVKELLRQRKNTVVTSATLQRDLLKEKGITVSESAIRKALHKFGYRWLNRSQKRCYTPKERLARLLFAKKLKRKGKAGLKKYLSMSFDGVVLAMAPRDDVDRRNHCMEGETKMWRKKGESALPELAGADSYADQVPLARAVPLWAGIGTEGVCEILMHPQKKCTVEEWLKAVRAGKLSAACKQVSKHKRPFTALTDNEKFLKNKEVRKAYAAKRLSLLHIPPRSPDLNMIEKFWGWLRAQLRRRDLKDLNMKRPAPGKTAFKARVRSILRAKKTQKVAGRFAGNLLKVCNEVIKKNGAASRC